MKRNGRVLWTARGTGGHLARDEERSTHTARQRAVPLLYRSSLSLSLFLLLFLPWLSLPVARHELTYSLERRVCVLTRSAYVMGARWSPPLWYRISMPIRRAGCRGATATSSSLFSSSVDSWKAAARVDASWFTSDVLGRGHGGATILIRSRLPDTRRCCWWWWWFTSSFMSSFSSMSSSSLLSSSSTLSFPSLKSDASRDWSSAQ